MDDASVWDGNWAWSLPLILVTVIFHVIGLVFINQKVIRAKRFLRKGRGFLAVFSMILGAATLVAILLHAIEAAIWATHNRISLRDDPGTADAAKHAERSALSLLRRCKAARCIRPCVLAFRL